MVKFIVEKIAWNQENVKETRERNSKMVKAENKEKNT